MPENVKTILKARIQEMNSAHWIVIVPSEL